MSVPWTWQQATLKKEQQTAAKVALPNPGASALASFNVKTPVKLIKYTKGDNKTQSGFTVDQNGVQFGFGSFASQYDPASKFDPTKTFEISGGGDTPVLKQGSLTFHIPNPVALTNPTDPESLGDPNAKAPAALARVPKNVGGKIASTAASQATSKASFNKVSPVGLRKPLLAGY